MGTSKSATIWLMNNISVFDGHLDTFTELAKMRNSDRRSFFKVDLEHHLDLPRSKKSSFIGGIFSIFTPPPESSPESRPDYAYSQIKRKSEITYSPIDSSYAANFTNSTLDYISALEKDSQGQIQIVRKFKHLRDCINSGTMAVVLHFEGAEAIKRDLSNLSAFYDRGLRSLAPVWSRRNDFGEGVPFKFPHSPDTDPGLTRDGKMLIKECNRLGIMIDLAHINLNGFWDVARLSHRPLVVTHSNVYKLCKSTRNLTDEQIEAVGKSNGVVGISFVSEIINPEGSPDNNMPLSLIVEQIDYISQKIGVDHVGLGSDFDGSDMPLCIKDVSGLPRLIEGLRLKGYDDNSLEKIAFKNWLRIFRDTWNNAS